MQNDSPIPTGRLIVVGAIALGALGVLFAAGSTGPPPATEPPPLAAEPLASTDPPPTTTPPGSTTAPVTTINRRVEGAPGWLAHSGGPVSPRVGAAAAWVDGRYVLWGGLPYGDGATSDGATFGRGAGWRPRDEPRPAPFAGADGIVLVPGDDRVLLTASDGTAIFHPDTDGWLGVEPPDDGPVAVPLAGAWTGSEYIVIGRQRNGADHGALAATAYGADGSCCRTVRAPKLLLTDAWAFWTGDQLLLIGGHYVGDTNRPLAERPGFASYDPAADAWEILPAPDLQAVQALSAAWTGTELVVWDYSLSAAAWHPDRGWRELPDLPFRFAECYPEMAAANGKAFAFYCGAAAYFDPAADRWVQMWTPEWDSLFPPGSCTPVGSAGHDSDIWMWCTPTTGEAPTLWSIDLDAIETIRVSAPARQSVWELVPHPEWSPRRDASLVWTGTELMIWGGWDGITEVFDGWAYQPGTGGMHRIPDAPSPGRPGQSGVWTGSEFVVWRGPVTAWDPDRVDWRTIETTTPTIQLHPGNTAVWTGSEVLFWGASQFVSGSDGGASLNLDTGAFRRLAPSPHGPRTDPVVTWSGEEMFVWGGRAFGAGDWAQDGAAYDPATEQWRELALPPAELQLSGPVGGWVDGELIVVGARSDPSVLDGQPHPAGAAYDPRTDTWRGIADFPDPIRPGEGIAGAMSAVVAGDRLAVWLPAPYFGDEPGFGFYEPASDSWVRYSGAPVDAYAPELTWTGTQVAALTGDGLLLLSP